MKHVVCLTIVLCLCAISFGELSFTFEQVGSTVYNEGQEFPYEFNYELAYTGLDPQDAPIDDYHLLWPMKVGGYIKATPPEGWSLGTLELYGIGYENNTGAPLVNENGSLGGWKIEAKTPQLVGGEAWLTNDGDPIGLTMQVMLPAPEPTTVSLLALGALSLLRKRRS